LDVFTATPLTGNGLAVVHDADSVDDATMLAFARETKLSETTFVQSGDGDADYRNRIWATLRELPFAGHPSLGTAVAVARRRGVACAHYVQRTPAGLQPCDVEIDGLLARASMLQEPAASGPELDAGEVLSAIGLTAADAHPDLPAQVMSTGAKQVLVVLSGVEALARARPVAAEVDALLGRTDAITVYAVACDPDAGRADARAFYRSPEGVAGEDPATGSAAGPLMAYLSQRTGLGTLTISQGVQMGRPSRLDCSVEGDRVRVGGEVVVVAEGTVTLRRYSANQGP